ncbi:MAG: acyloxyacyl hydrolase [Saprospiraceae bacterium]|nr:acyloxyacyl hydrolase [Saprospiraceae bacterium]
MKSTGNKHPRGAYIALFLFYMMLLSTASFGQQWYLKAGFNAGKHFKHSTKTTYDVPGWSYSQEISLLYQTSGSHGWDLYFGRPRLGLNLMYTDFGNKEVLGHALGFYPSIEYFLKRNAKTGFTFQLGVGIGRVSRYFDYNDNPLNNAIGSGWNNISRLGFLFDHQLTAKSKFNAQLFLTHFSNGGVQLPNLGINVASMGVGFLHILSDHENYEFKAFHPDTTKVRKTGLDLMTGIGISEYATYGGPKLPSYFFSLAAYHRLSPYLRLYLGAEYEYSEPVFQFFYQDFNDRITAFKKASNYSAFLSTELMHGPFAFRFQTGYYLPLPDIRIDKSPLYFKLHLLTYAGNDRWKLRPYGGFLLKTHFSVAQYIGIVAGARI